MSSYVYLAVPYSHPDVGVREERYTAANKAMATLITQGVAVYSPISQTHVLAEVHDMPTDFEGWRHQDTALLQHASHLIVLQLDGWQDSYGVKEEMQIAGELGLPVIFVKFRQEQIERVGRLLVEFAEDEEMDA